jgi:ABC-type branched-subunit amino acid transport system permease subunit
MHVGTHFFAGWMVAVAPALSRRERAFVAFAGVAPDLDGLGIVPEMLTADSAHPLTWYSLYHHVLGHNLGFALVVTALAFALARRRALTAALVLAAFHLHLLCDLAGSRGTDGEQWPIPYLYPFSGALQLTWSGQWTLGDWRNTAITAVLLLATVVAAWWWGRSPLGLFTEKGDAVVVATLRRRIPRSAA